MFYIQPLKKRDLPAFADLLRLSYSKPTFDLKDEHSYFDLMPNHSWFGAVCDGEPVGFIRCFWITDELYLMEAYGSSSVVLALCQHFKEHHQLGKHVSVRFDLDMSQQKHVDLRSIIKQVFEHISVTPFYTMHRKPQKPKTTVCLRRQCPLNMTQIKQVIEILNEFRCYTAEDLAQYDHNEQLFVCLDGAEPRAAAYIQREDVGELVMMATHHDHRQQGWGRRLMADITQWADMSNMTLVLKVDQRNVAAQRLYARFGFMKQSEQLWHCCAL